MNSVFHYQGEVYPEYIRQGNAMRFIQPAAEYFCKGRGVDVGCSEWPLPGAIPLDIKQGGDAYKLPGNSYDYIFSSHCLEHLPDYIGALRHWISCLKPGGVLFLYLPHPDMKYWHPLNCSKHMHTFPPSEIRQVFEGLGLLDVMVSGRDMYWSFCVVGVLGNRVK